jgi:2-methylcitrate dehydratase PrpD
MGELRTARVIGMTAAGCGSGKRVEECPMKRRSVLKLMAAPAVATVLGSGIWRQAVSAPAVFRDNAIATRSGPPSVSEQIAAFLARARFEHLPASVVQKAKEQIVFLLGRAFEGSSTDPARQLDEVAPLLGAPSRRGASVIGRRYRLAPGDAAFANCSLMRGDTGNDDLLWPAMIHAGPVTLPVALALGEIQLSSGKDLILALVLGYEIMGKLGRAANPWEAPLPRRAQNVYGAFGPVVTAAHLLGLGETQLANALAYAVNIEMGIAEGSMMHHYYSFLASSGLLAAQLAGAGGAAYGRTTIEGDLGLYKSFVGHVPDSLSGLIGALGSDWEILHAEQKRFFSTGGGTANNDVAMYVTAEALREEHLTADDIERIDVVLPYGHYAKERRDAVASQGPFARVVDAEASLPYSIALLALFGRELDPKWFGDDLMVMNEPSVAHVMQRVFVTFESGHNYRYCRLQVTTVHGRRVGKEVEDYKLLFPRDEWSEWLQRRGVGLLTDAQLRTLEASIADLENLRDVSALMASLVPAKDRQPA